ncbi:MAG: hypothetical protein A2632_00210 [Candidatus Pacebacteria bacterium RIFCSPHIGHO2_01_FULL_46_16]|nr:MAG: hypothetical protein A2632_00210 [Candidatus Pacebacteria bacterium RIFCSPHIGHO2_01_FULL_46_16]
MNNPSVATGSLRSVTLNIEGHKHLARWVPVVKALEPDVVCLQEVFAVDLPEIEQQLGMRASFLPLSNILEVNRYKIHPLGLWGIAQLTKLPTRNRQAHQYGGDVVVPVFHEPNDSQRTVLSQEIEKNAAWHTIATTHFTWSKGGEITQLQREDFQRLATIIRSYDELVLCGDFNAPRGKELFTLFESLLIDRLPQVFTTTIDPNLHYGGDLQLVVDTIFTTAGYEVIGVHPFAGVSDHMGVVGEVSVIPTGAEATMPFGPVHNE